VPSARAECLVLGPKRGDTRLSFSPSRIVCPCS
jgi:hypothetical protein